MSKLPWMKFYPADWRADPSLKSCGLAARGLWIEMLAIMHEADPRGALVINKKPVGTGQLASLVGAPDSFVSELLAELSHAGVFSTRRNGVIFSRRIERDEIRASKMRDNGRKGGNPSLCKSSERLSLDNQEDITQISEARDQRRKKDSLGASAPSEPASQDRFEEFWQVYPKREGPNPKKPALIVFKRLIAKGTDPATIIAAAFALAKDHPAPTRFCPQAQTWLGQERFADQGGAGGSPVAVVVWEKRLTHARARREWASPKWGPVPGAAGCLVPPSLLKDDDGAGWREMELAA